MIAPNATILLQDGKADFEVLECSKSADVCLKAFVECDKPGKVFVRKGMLEKSKANKAQPKSEAGHQRQAKHFQGRS